MCVCHVGTSGGDEEKGGEVGEADGWGDGWKQTVGWTSTESAWRGGWTA